MKQFSFACARIFCAAALIALGAYAKAEAIPVFANGQGVSCRTCHTTYPGMTPYGMMTMMTNFQNLDWKKQRDAFPLAIRSQIVSFLGNSEHPASTMVNTLSLLGGGFLGKNFTWYGEQPIVDGGQPGVTEQLWVSWNGLLHGTNSIQIGKAHTWFPFMPAHGWTLSDYLLATQDNGQNSFEPNDSRWGATFNGMSNEFMYGLSYTTGVDPIQRAFDFNKTDGNRVLDFNVSYGGMTRPWTVGAVGIRGTAPLVDGSTKEYVDSDSFSREGLYYSYQTSRWLVQTMVYHGYDNQPDIGTTGAPFNGAMLELQRDFSPQDHLIARYDVASSDELNRQYIVDYAHNFLPNMKSTFEVGMTPQGRPSFGVALDFAGPWISGKRLLIDGFTDVAAASTPPPIAQVAVETAAPAGNANNGAKLVQANGCEGCHGAGLTGGKVGPKLYGIENQLTAAQIADFIRNPRAPMPNFGFTTDQINDIVAYLSGLDGGAGGAKPVVTFDPNPPVDVATMTVRFPGTPPKSVSALPVMQMGASSMQTRSVQLQPSKEDPHVFTGRVVFSMGGPWTIRIRYDGQTLDVPVTVGS